MYRCRFCHTLPTCASPVAVLLLLVVVQLLKQLPLLVLAGLRLGYERHCVQVLCYHIAMQVWCDLLHENNIYSQVPRTPGVREDVCLVSWYPCRSCPSGKLQ
jgi:hypothetical protein